MKQEEKQLLLQDLCARLPYGVKVQYNNEIYNIDYISALYEEVYLFGAYLSAQQNGQNAWGNFICGFTSMPSFEDLKQEIKVHKDGINDLVIISMQFITREQFYALKG